MVSFEKIPKRRFKTLFLQKDSQINRKIIFLENLFGH